MYIFAPQRAIAQNCEGNVNVRIVNVGFRLDGGFLHFSSLAASGKITWFLQDEHLIGRPQCNNEHGYENCPGYFSILCALFARLELSFRATLLSIILNTILCRYIMNLTTFCLDCCLHFLSLSDQCVNSQSQTVTCMYSVSYLFKDYSQYFGRQLVLN